MVNNYSMQENNHIDRSDLIVVNAQRKAAEQIEKEKNLVIKKLSTNNLVERYETVFRLCKLYKSWALKKKSQQAEDITRQESFEIYPYLPLNL